MNNRLSVFDLQSKGVAAAPFTGRAIRVFLLMRRAEWDAGSGNHAVVSPPPVSRPG
jgi:hypothetical protein